MYVTRKANMGYQPVDVIFGPILTTPMAIGLAVGSGNMGSRLSERSDFMGTYFTRDAGWTWNKISAGNNIYEFADHGGLMLMANLTSATDLVSYSWNEGYSFTTCKFASFPFEVENIVVDPTSTSTQFVVHGYRVQSGVKTGVIVHFDFSGLHERQCEDSDYEIWSPTDSQNITGSCYLGQQLAYTRRRRFAECFNGDDFEPLSVLKSCPCSREDYECDFCYEYKDLFCEQISGCVVDPAPCSGGFQNVSNGYRLIAEDKCTLLNGGLNLLPKPIPCDGGSVSSPSHRAKGGVVTAVVIVIILIVIAMAGGGFYLYKKNKNLSFKYLRPGGDDSTALDEDLLESRDAIPIDEEDIARNLKAVTSNSPSLISTDDM